MRRERVAHVRSAVLTIVVLAGIGLVLSNVAAPYLQFCEFVILIGWIGLLWECLRAEGPELRGMSIPDFRPWDVEQAIARLQPITHEAPLYRPRRIAMETMEQITNEILTGAFSQSARKRHSAH